MRALTLVLGLTACATEPAVDSIQQASAKPGEDGTGGGCPVWGCGSNTSKVHGIPFIDVHEGGQANSDGFSIVRFEQQIAGVWTRFDPDVQDAQLLARHRRTGAIVLQGGQVEGGRFVLHNTSTTLDYYLTVVAVDEMTLWAQDDWTDPVWTHIYRLQWQDPTSPNVPEDICGVNPDGAVGGGVMADFHAVLFDDDRVDTDQLRFTGEVPGWFNIGCAGHALAKMHLLGQTRAASNLLGVATTLTERTANLKMITGDYCGNGLTFTVPGEPLLWRDAHGWYDTTTMPPATAVLEARWFEGGALCLNTPRVDHNGLAVPLGVATFPDGVSSLLPRYSLEWCATRPPPCQGTFADQDGAAVISVNQ
jgi:hypothetical protein